MIFNVPSWRDAIRDLPADLVTSVELAALEVSSHAPCQSRGGADPAPISEYIDRLREALRCMIARSPDPRGLPNPDLGVLELTLWALGLAFHLTRRSGCVNDTVDPSELEEPPSRKEQPRQGSVAPVSRMILETADRIGERAREGLARLRREREGRRPPAEGGLPGAPPEAGPDP